MRLKTQSLCTAENNAHQPSLRFGWVGFGSVPRTTAPTCPDPSSTHQKKKRIQQSAPTTHSYTVRFTHHVSTKTCAPSSIMQHSKLSLDQSSRCCS
jgi:hypothetical protein